MIQRLNAANAFGIVIDVQDFFLREIPADRRAELESDLVEFTRMLDVLKMPAVFTVERPVATKGGLPAFLHEAMPADSLILEKNFFDLTAEPGLATSLANLGRRQAILAGGETDVCVLQSALGLRENNYEVFVAEDLVFTSSKDASAAFARLRGAGAVVASFKTIFHELVRAVEGSAHRTAGARDFKSKF